ncbi:MAG: hypothetical protein J6Y02_23905 [Pseudobutyrivibrio sp.]|nr:hypothetical protein [Pseudobutyrivibrio sp.]
MDYETTSTAQEILDTTATPTGHSTGTVVAAAIGGFVTGILGTIGAIKAYRIKKAEEKREAEKALIREVMAEINSETEA